MKIAKIFFHPILLHRRTRLIFIWYVTSSLVTSAILWWGLQNLLTDAGAGSVLFTGKVFSRPLFRALVVLASGLFATVITAGALVGPVHRIEEWLTGKNRLLSSRSLRVRPGDPFETLIRILNELRIRGSAPEKKKKPRARGRRPKASKAPKLRAI